MRENAEQNNSEYGHFLRNVSKSDCKNIGSVVPTELNYKTLQLFCKLKVIQENQELKKLVRHDFQTIRLQDSLFSNISRIINCWITDFFDKGRNPGKERKGFWLSSLLDGHGWIFQSINDSLFSSISQIKEPVICRCFSKYTFLKISQYSQEKTLNFSVNQITGFFYQQNFPLEWITFIFVHLDRHKRRILNLAKDVWWIFYLSP